MLAEATLARLREHMADSPFDALVLGVPENVGYATGYRSVAGDIFSSHRMAAVVTADDVAVAAPAADAGAISEHPVRLEAYGRFFFEGPDGSHPAVSAADQHPDFGSALRAACSSVSGIVGVDGAVLPGSDAASALPDPDRVADAGAWMARVRSVKLPGEVELLGAAAHLAEKGIEAAIAGAAPGATERDLARIVASTMTNGGGMPRFVVVTSGERSALSDSRATERILRPGDLVRLDVGCTVDGYWSDVGRTAVVGAPDRLQNDRYAAILAGEEAQLEVFRAGVTGGHLFDVAVAAVEAGGIKPYRRHHCGHGIGSSVYEPPSVAPAGADHVLAAGMVLCLETPYYEIGWGGMMVEDTLVATTDGYDLLTHIDRGMRVIPA